MRTELAKRTCRVAVAAVILAAFFGCGDESVSIRAGECVPETDPWTSEALYGDLGVSFPCNYAGEGFTCFYDTCEYAKTRLDGSVVFRLPFGELTGFEPATFAELPETYIYKHRELVSSPSGRSGALYYTLDSEVDWVVSAGIFVFESKDGQGFVEALWVTYDSSAHDEVIEILRSIDYRAE